MTVNSLNTYIVPTAANEVTQPSQPGFVAYNDTNRNNVTGAGGNVEPVPFNVELFDQNADYDNTTYTFTAPVTGRYVLESTIAIADIAAAMTGLDFSLITSNRDFDSTDLSPGASFDVNGEINIAGAFLADMDAADTAHIKISITNGAGDNADILAATANTMRTRFTGFLPV